MLPFEGLAGSLGRVKQLPRPSPKPRLLHGTSVVEFHPGVTTFVLLLEEFVVFVAGVVTVTGGDHA
jgi:hypothetical protein